MAAAQFLHQFSGSFLLTLIFAVINFVVGFC